LRLLAFAAYNPPLVRLSNLISACSVPAQGLDLELKNDPQFKTQIAGIILHGLGLNKKLQARDCRLRAGLSVICRTSAKEVTLWHGQMDNYRRLKWLHQPNVYCSR
jgi:hypothetical protein